MNKKSTRVFLRYLRAADMRRGIVRKRARLAETLARARVLREATVRHPLTNDQVTRAKRAGRP